MNTRILPGRISVHALLITAALGICSCSGDDATTKKEATAPQASPPATVPAERSAGSQPANIVTAREQPATSSGNSNLLPGEDWLQRYVAPDFDAAFDAVTNGIRYEPYRGVLRGAARTALARTGNSLDQSLLLATILRRSGFRVRFVQGRLVGDNLGAVLRGMYPPNIPDTNFGADYAPYDPDTDPGLDAAIDHFWLEVYQPGNWLPLDPSFPRAVPGQAYARALARHDEIPAEYYQTLNISLKQELHNGQIIELGSLKEPVARLGLTPLSLIIHRVPKSSTENSKKPQGTGATLGGMGGSLTGSDPEKQSKEEVPQIVAVEHQRRLFVSGEFIPWEGTLVAEQARPGFIRREWLEFEIATPGAVALRSERDLFRYNANDAIEPQAVRHYAISVVPGPLTEEWLEAERARIAATLNLKKWQRELRKATKLEPDSKAAEKVAPALQKYGNLAGISAGHLVGLTFAAASDDMSRQVAWTNGVEVIWPLPRILITSIETEMLDDGRTESYVTLDLRLDRVQSVPWPGFPSRAAKLFQTARGLQNTVLESSVLSDATGIEMPVTAAVVMIKAADDGTSLLTIDPASAESLSQLDGLPQHSAELITAALRDGHDVIVPQRAARLGDRDRWGWWQVNRNTGEVIGVMEDGQHQASTNYTFSLSKVGLDDDMGFAIGAIIGADSTLFTISGLMLKYGETSPQMIAEVEKYVKSIMCRSCPSGAGISAGASGSASAGNDCMKIEKKFEAQIGASAKIGFCESYQKGFACASGLLLNGLTGSGAASASYGGQVGVDVQVNCEHAFGGLKVDDTGYTTNGPNTIRN